MRPWYYTWIAFVSGLLIGAFLVGYIAVSEAEQDITNWIIKHRIAPLLYDKK